MKFLKVQFQTKDGNNCFMDFKVLEDVVLLKRVELVEHTEKDHTLDLVEK